MRIGIITMYYGSTNYGGLLQAYALEEVLRELGYDCEQISYQRSSGKIINAKKVKKLIFDKKAVLIIKKIIIVVRRYMIYFFTKKRLQERNELCHRFRSLIPHSKVYTEENIKECIDDYDVFICGSDQIWNPFWWTDGYLLGFVPKGKKKIAYAPSIARQQLSLDELNYLVQKIKDFNALSLRESTLIPILQKSVGRDIFHAIDPTLLLGREKYVGLIGEPIVKERYILVYLLGNNSHYKHIIRKFAEREKMKLVYIPYVGEFGILDACYGKQKIYSAGPIEFLNLINNAGYVITDSFHCTVFSIIFEKKFYNLKRDSDKKASSMNDRLEVLLKSFGIDSREFDGKTENLLEIDYAAVRKKMCEYQEASMNYLKSAIEK